MTDVKVGDLTIAYQMHGRADDPVVLLIQGLGMPLTAWPQALVQTLVDDRYCVVTFDNRDIGRSEKLDHLPTPSIGWQALRHALGLSVRAPYSLDAMADDTAGLLQALDVPKAHVVGVSMGGMIAQLLAIREPSRLLSLTSIMSTTGRRGLPQARPDVRRHLLRKPRSSALEDVVALGLKTWRLIGSPAYPTSDEERREFLVQNYRRGVARSGIMRQLLAIAAAPARNEMLQGVATPTLVVHGREDPLIPPACGEDTAASIPSASLHLIDGMGHDLPAALIAPIAEELTLHFAASVAS